jgi:hypothetical protein
MANTTYKGPSAYNSLDEFLDANMSNEMRKVFKLPIKPEENNPTSAPTGAPTGRRLTEAEWERLVPDTKEPTDAPTDAPAYYHYSMPGRRLTEAEWERCIFRR